MYYVKNIRYQSTYDKILRKKIIFLSFILF